MQIKRYEATNLREAKARIKKDLGPDAIILSIKKISDTPPLTEIVAARDEKNEYSSSLDTHLHKKEHRQDDLLFCLTKEIHDLKSNVEELKHQFINQGNFFGLKEMMNIVLNNVSIRYPSHLQDIYMRLVANGISHLKAIGLIEEIRSNYKHDDADTYEKGTAIAEKMIARTLVKDNPKEHRIKAFVGPTGVGKTTTLAKLAAHYSLEKKLKVGMITTDTFRIAAPQQLKIYANIMGLPLLVASEKNMIAKSLASFSELDIVLIDTPGRNNNDKQYLDELKSMLHSDTETFLLLSPIASRDYLLDTANRFKIFNYNHIILTKVDECSHFGCIYDVLDEIRKPVSYVTTGQNVPKDIAKANPEGLARLILQNRLN